MKFGISLSGFAQQPVGTNMRDTLVEILEYVKAARELGFDFIYQGQHYLAWPYQQLQVIPLLARLSAEAEGMGVVATLLLPLHNPVDLAERVATMDIITGGRFILSAALGYRDEEYDAFGVDRKQRVSRYVECLEVMKRLWTQEVVTFEGKHFRLQGARMPLKPIQKPHPPIWIAANGDDAVRRAARLGYPWYVNPHATYTTIQRQMEIYREAAREAGTILLQGLPIAREVYVHESRERAFEEVQQYIGGKYEAYARWGQDKALPGQESFSGSFEDLAADRFIIGTPEDCITELEKYRSLGIGYGSFRMMWPGMALEKGIASMELFARHVMPHFSEA